MKEKALKKLNELLEREEKRPLPYREITNSYQQQAIKNWSEKQQGVVNGIKLAIEEIELLKEDK